MATTLINDYNGRWTPRNDFPSYLIITTIVNDYRITQQWHQQKLHHMTLFCRTNLAGDLGSPFDCDCVLFSNERPEALHPLRLYVENPLQLPHNPSFLCLIRYSTGAVPLRSICLDLTGNKRPNRKNIFIVVVCLQGTEWRNLSIK